MKILHVIQGMGKGGAERLCLDIAHEFKRKHKEHKLLIVALSKTNEYPLLTKEINIIYISVKFSLSIFKKNNIDIYEYEKIVDEFKPDVIHSHTYIAELVTRENYRKNIKYFTHVHSDFNEFKTFIISTIFNKKLFTNFYEKKRLLNKYRKSNTSFITISNDVKKNLLSQLDKKLCDNVILLENAINYKKFNKSSKPKFNSNQIKLVSIGRLYQNKNHIYLVDVLKEIKLKNKNAYLTIIGDGPEIHKIKKRALKLKVLKNINFLGLVNELENELSKHHILVHSALHEAFGLVLLEAMAAGLPVVCLDAGGNRDLIENNQNGFILDSDCSPKVFAEKIELIFNDIELYYRLSNFSKVFAKKYDIKEYSEKLLEFYKK